MAKMGLAAVYQRPRTTVPHPEHKIWPYLLRDLTIDRPNQVWCADITYIAMRRGFLYLVAVMDWAPRKVLAWRLSNTLDVELCLEALEEALARYGRPEIFNSERQRATGSSAGASPGKPIHQSAVHRGLDRGWHSGVDGRAWSLDR
jgi:putative transposase